MAEIPTSQFAHYCSEIDAAVDEVIAALGGRGSLNARLAAIEDALAAKVDSSDFAADQQRQEAEIGVVANAGAKNWLQMTHTSEAITRYGVTCTWDLNAGTMTLNGTHSSGDSAAIFEFYDGSAEATKILPAGSYTLTGCPAGGSTSTYRALLTQIAGAVDVGNGANFELSEPHYAAYRILISGNVTFNNMVFKPMLRPAEITDSTFIPYAPTNRELYKECETKVTMQQVYGDATEIPANSNLNNYTTPGLYYALVANVPTIINTPYTSTGFRLVVEKNTPSGAAVFQTIYPTSRSHLEFFRRIYEGGSWSSWYKFEGTPVTY